MVNNYFKKNKEKLWKEARERYQNLYEEKKEKKCQCHRHWNKSLSEKESESWVYEIIIST